MPSHCPPSASASSPTTSAPALPYLSIYLSIRLPHQPRGRPYSLFPLIYFFLRDILSASGPETGHGRDDHTYAWWACASMPPRSTTKATRAAEPRGAPASTGIFPLGAIAPTTEDTATLVDAKTSGGKPASSSTTSSTDSSSQAEEIDPHTLGVPGLRTLSTGDRVEILWRHGAPLSRTAPEPTRSTAHQRHPTARRLGEGPSPGVRARDAESHAGHYLPYHVRRRRGGPPPAAPPRPRPRPPPLSAYPFSAWVRVS
jgi:hypothetical protein